MFCLKHIRSGNDYVKCWLTTYTDTPKTHKPKSRTHDMGVASPIPFCLLCTSMCMCIFVIHNRTSHVDGIFIGSRGARALRQKERGSHVDTRSTTSNENVQINAHAILLTTSVAAHASSLQSCCWAYVCMWGHIYRCI